MSADWCRMVEEKLSNLQTDIESVRKAQNDLIKIVVVGLLTIVGAVVGVQIAL